MGPELIDELIEVRPKLPGRWLQLAPDRALEYLRCRLRFSQAELARKAGLSQSRVSVIEGGAEACLGTWRKLYAAMGFDLLLVPVTEKDFFELEAFADAGRPERHYLRTPARPRRRRMRAQEEKRA